MYHGPECSCTVYNPSSMQGPKAACVTQQGPTTCPLTCAAQAGRLAACLDACSILLDQALHLVCAVLASMMSALHAGLAGCTADMYHLQVD